METIVKGMVKNRTLLSKVVEIGYLEVVFVPVE